MDDEQLKNIERSLKEISVYLWVLAAKAMQITDGPDDLPTPKDWRDLLRP